MQFYHNSGLGSGGHKQWMSCSERKHFEIMKNNLAEHAWSWSSFCEDWSAAMLHIRDLVRDPFSPRSPLLSLSSKASLFLPKYPQTRKTGSSRAWRKQRSNISLIRSSLRNADHLRNATRERCMKSFPWSICQMTCMDTPLANTFVLARVLWPLHSQFLFPGRAWGLFFLLPPLFFLARGQPSPQNRLQDRYCREPRSITWLEERMKSEMKSHSFLFLTP